MFLCLSLPGAFLLTAIWLIGISYLDYQVARYRRETGAFSQRLGLERVFGLPWDLSTWLVSGGIVLTLTMVSALISFWALLALGLLGLIMILFILLEDGTYFQTARSARSATVAWLHGIEGVAAGQSWQVGAQGLSIGRSNHNSLILPDPTVSRQHVQIVAVNSQFQIVDMNSKSGTFLNGNPIQKAALHEEDQLVIGENILVFRASSHPPLMRSNQLQRSIPTASLNCVRGEHGDRSFALNGNTVYIGRVRTNHIVLTEPQVSRSHARICFAQRRWYIQDQNSLAGTFVNGRRIHAISLQNGDRVRIGRTEFEFREHIGH